MYLYSLPHCRISTGTNSCCCHLEQSKHTAETLENTTPFIRHARMCPYHHLIMLHQQHSAEGVCITANDDVTTYTPYQYTGDYIVSTKPYVACAIATADCAPIIIHTPAAQIIAAVHAGWRGIASNIIYNALYAMQNICDIAPNDLYAYIGPCARLCCYTVNWDIITHIQYRIPGTTWYRQHNEKPYMDMYYAAAMQLHTCGIPLHHIHGPGICTICNPACASYRRNKTPYRHITYGVCVQSSNGCAI